MPSVPQASFETRQVGAPQDEGGDRDQNGR